MITILQTPLAVEDSRHTEDLPHAREEAEVETDADAKVERDAHTDAKVDTEAKTDADADAKVERDVDADVDAEAEETPLEQKRTLSGLNALFSISLSGKRSRAASQD